ncbi:MAG: hypothetical protein ACLT98_13030 [Eggerthellaceae bacterium]
MLYFGSLRGGTYDRTFSYGDGYHALGSPADHRWPAELPTHATTMTAKFDVRQFISILPKN